MNYGVYFWDEDEVTKGMAWRSNNASHLLKIPESKFKNFCTKFLYFMAAHKSGWQGVEYLSSKWLLEGTKRQECLAKYILNPESIVLISSPSS